MLCWKKVTQLTNKSVCFERTKGWSQHVQTIVGRTSAADAPDRTASVQTSSPKCNLSAHFINFRQRNSKIDFHERDSRHFTTRITGSQMHSLRPVPQVGKGDNGANIKLIMQCQIATIEPERKDMTLLLDTSGTFSKMLKDAQVLRITDVTTVVL